jgi:hypothetical protein
MKKQILGVFGLLAITALAQNNSEGIDTNELIAMITSFSGPVSERPFVPPLTHPAIGDGSGPVSDPVANLIRDVQEGRVRLKFEGADGYLRCVNSTSSID